VEEKTMSVEENVKLVKDGYAAFGRGDIQGLLGLLSEDVVWETPGEGLPLAGTYIGREAVARFFQKLGEEAEILAFEQREFVGQDDQVVVIGWQRGNIRATNRAYETSWVMVFTIRGGKISRFREFSNTLAIANAYASTARAAG
jgi:hypothetical protein